MLTIDIAILQGRYHATPWGRHVNEGVPEWPPSPFRLVRTLYDAWKRKRPDWSADRVEPILRALASQDPLFELPPARSSHIRIFYRQGGEAESDKKLVFDPFVVVNPGAVARLGWPSVDLSASMQSDLDELLAVVGYLGRAESLVTLTRSDAPLQANCSPADASAASRDTELVRVAGVARPDEHIEIQLGKPKRKGAAPELLTWLDALTWGTAEVQAKKLSDPPALRWVGYRRSSDALEARAPIAARPTMQQTDTVLLSIQGKIKPRVEDTVMVAERLRRFAMGAHKVLVRDPKRGSLTLAGKASPGVPGKDHQHAYYLPWDRDGDGEIDHVIVHAAAGLDRSEIAALDRIYWPQALNRGQPLAVVPVATGTREMFEPATRFRSATPFIPPRHYRQKRDGDHAEWLVRQLELELEHHHPGVRLSSALPMPQDGREVGRKRRWLEYRRARKGETPKLGYGFTIEVADPIHGPFAIGSGAHFGLGLFVPDGAKHVG